MARRTQDRDGRSRHGHRIGWAAVLGTGMAKYSAVLNGVNGKNRGRSYRTHAPVKPGIWTCITSTGYVLLIDWNRDTAKYSNKLVMTGLNQEAIMAALETI